MRYPWANIALLIMLLFQFVTGYLGLTNGDESWKGWLVLHSMVGFGTLSLLFWKGRIILDVYRRGIRINWAHLSFIILTVLLILTISSGILWATNGPHYLGGFSLITIHVFLALSMIGLLIWHLLKKVFILNHPEVRSRRLFLNTGINFLLGVILWRSTKWGKTEIVANGINRRFTGSYETGSFTGIFPPTIWIADNPEPIDSSIWELKIDGEILSPYKTNYQTIVEFADTEIIATLDCTGGWYSTQTWFGVPLSKLLNKGELKSSAKSVTLSSVTGYYRIFSLKEINKYLLALAVAGTPLAHSHGGPARLVAPGKRGFEWVKWVTKISVNKTSKHWQSPLPLQ